MNRFETFSDEELNALREALTLSAKSAKGLTRKRKLKVVAKTAATLITIVGGTVVTVLFPSPISVALLSVAVGYISGNSGVRKEVSKIRGETSKLKTSKKDLEGVDSEVNSRKTLKGIMDHVTKLGIIPSAPQQQNQLYPDLPQ